MTAVLAVVVHDETRVSLCEPMGIKDDRPVRDNVDRGQAERVCAEALDQPNEEAALRPSPSPMDNTGPTGICWAAVTKNSFGSVP